MSKRDKGASLTTYMEDNFVPEALVNYLCLLGWSPKGNREIMPLEEIIKLFDLPQILRHNARFDMEKLQWMNWEYIRALSSKRFVELGNRALEKAGLSTAEFPPEYVDRALATCKEKVKLFSDLPGFADFYFLSNLQYDTEAAAKYFVPDNKIRLACTGKTIGPSLYHLIEVLGRDRALKRLDDAIARIGT
jgi:glutamyl/glutaminyl-tRNA synthetase